MPLLQLRQVDYSVGGPLLLDHVDFTLDANERVCIVGRNGAGKSTLMKLIAGEIRPDDGTVQVDGGTRVARLAQEVPQATAGSVFDVVAQGLGELGTWLAQFHHLSHALDVPGNTEALAAVQTRIESVQGWDLDRRVGDVLARLDLPEDADFAALSGGMKRRVLLAQALVQAPDVLLLDEPTNHLDIESIAWMEDFLRQFRGSIVFVTHDRSFLRALATRIVEIDRGKLTSWPGDYDNYLRRREERLHAEAQENARFDKLLAQEEVWIRQGIKARRTRDEGRVRRLKQMRVERAQRRELSGTARMELADAAKSGKRVIEAKNVYFAFERRPMVVNFSCNIQRGDRIGIIGPNGSGKTTCIRMICGLLTPDAGEGQVLGLDVRRDQRRIRREVGYMTQRFSFYEDLSIEENLVFVAGLYGLPRQAVADTLSDLGLSSRKKQLAASLSGGWKQRLALAACIMHQPKLLLLDEPTAGVDPKARREFWDEIHRLAGDGLTVLVSTHYMDEAERCHRIGYIAYGRMLATGTVEEVVKGSGLVTYVVHGALKPAQIRALEAADGVEQVAPFGATLHVVGTDRGKLEAALEPVRREAGIKVEPGETSLEDVFIKFMTGAQERAA